MHCQEIEPNRLGEGQLGVAPEHERRAVGPLPSPVRGFGRSRRVPGGAARTGITAEILVRVRCRAGAGWSSSGGPVRVTAPGLHGPIENNPSKKGLRMLESRPDAIGLR